MSERETTVRRFRMKQERQLVEKILCALPFTAPSPATAPLSLNRKRLPAKSRTGAAFRPERRNPTTVRLGPGDDAAILSTSGQSDLVVSCDAFIEGVHFLRKTHSADSVGYKSLARATSDLAAMGAAPRYFLLTLALPKPMAGRWLDSFLSGMARASRELGMSAIGGDTTVSSQVAISITVLGEIARGVAVGRAGARPGDLIYVSGRLGRAQLGLQLVLAGHAQNRTFRSAAAPHLYPKIQVELGAWLARNRLATAMMDISDGLSTDLARLCSASRVGARIYVDKIPCVAIPKAISQRIDKHKIDPLQMALHGGEDYELLFTVSPSHAHQLRKAPDFAALACIGEIARGKKMTLIDPEGKRLALKPLGWDPF